MENGTKNWLLLRTRKKAGNAKLSFPVWSNRRLKLDELKSQAQEIDKQVAELKASK